MRNIDSDLIRGNIDTIILKTMLEEDKYGLDIIKEVEQRSSGTYELKQPTLYSCLKRLENQELISSYWLDSDIGGRRHYYKLTEKGREFYNKKQEEWAKSKFIIDNLLSNYDYQEYRLVSKDEYDQIQQDKEMLANAPTMHQNQPTITNTEEDAMSDKTPDNNSVYDDNSENSDEIEEDVNPLMDEPDSNEVFNDNDFTFSMDEHFDEDHDHDENFESHISTDLEDSQENFESETHDYFDDTQESNEDNSPIYYTDESTDTLEDSQPSNLLEQTDQSKNELNILRSLHMQDDEEINTYYGDQKSYVNHLNKDVEVHQENLLDDSLFTKSSEVDESINNFSNSISKLNGFNNSSELEIDSHDEEEQLDFSLENQDIRDEFHNDDSHEYVDEEPEEPEFDELDELKNLNPHSSTGFFKSFDDTDYTKTSTKEIENALNKREDIYSYDENDSSDASFEEPSNDPYEMYFNSSNNHEVMFDYSENSSSLKNTDDFEEDAEELSYNFGGLDKEDETTEDNEFIYTPAKTTEVCNIVSRETSSDAIETRNPDCFVDFRQNTDRYEQTNFNDIDEIISNNATSTFSYDDAIFAPLEIKSTTNNKSYKEKLSNLSSYSKVSLDDEKEERNTEEALSKAKDIAEITKEFEQEGIIVKEHYKNSTAKHFDRSYLMSTKINLIKSMILFFGYVFLLSAVYIVLNNTSFKDSFGFSIKYFLYGFIPFAVILLFRAAQYIISPYKKVPAKYASRIMTFISIIITIQLLLITYCLNLQMGFYSFSQLGYNHLYWLIPTMISFAPIFDNLIYMALYNSKNFHV